MVREIPAAQSRLRENQQRTEQRPSGQPRAHPGITNPTRFPPLVPRLRGSNGEFSLWPSTNSGRVCRRTIGSPPRQLATVDDVESKRQSWKATFDQFLDCSASVVHQVVYHLCIDAFASCRYYFHAFRVGSTPTPTCLPGQGGSRKRMRPSRQPSGKVDPPLFPNGGFFHVRRSLLRIDPG